MHPESVTVCCGQSPQHLRSHRETICIQSLSQFAVVKAHNFQIVTGPGKSGHYRDVALGDVST